MFDIITVGDATLDTFLEIHEASVQCDVNKKKCKLCFNYADKIPISDAHQSIGGDAANVAVGLAKLDRRVAIVSELGDDINGYTIEHELETAHVDTRHLKMITNAMSRYSVVLTYRGERTILAYHPKHHYSKPTLPKATRWIYFTSLGAGSQTIQTAVTSYLKKHPQTKLATNPGSYQLRAGFDTYRKIIPHAEVLFLNREEAALVTGKTWSLKRMIKALHVLGPKIVVITDGSNGSYASDRKCVYHHKNFPVKVVSKTGAGDAYASGFLGALLADKDLPTAMRWGTANAGSVIGQYGAQSGLLNETKILKMIKTHASIQPRLL